ncbi:MAG: zf-HC2 domain-containing protein, partial [Syntrophothermus sp.]
ELRALTLLAEGYSYREIGEITGFSATKINRCLAEGRERFRRFLARSEAGDRCAELQPLLSLYCDGEADAADADAVREHLRACAHCRAALRAYRAAPGAAAALAPALPVGRSLLERAHDALTDLASRLGGGGAAEPAATQIAAAGGARGAGVAALAKVLAICVGTAGGAAACVATGVVPAPALIAQDDGPAAIERPTPEPPAPEPPAAEPPPTEPEPQPNPTPEAEVKPQDKPTAEPAQSPPSSSGAVEYTPPPPEPPPPPASASPAPAAGSPAGEFGP